MCAHQIGDGCRRFNPRSPRGGATHHLQHRQMISKFQSTLPTRGSDAYAHVLALTHQLFQSTLPTRGSDFQRYPLIQPQPAVSIHAPHEGERPAFSAAAFSDKSFNPRSPRGGATRTFWRAYRIQYGFQSTLPTRGSDWIRCTHTS